MTHEIAKLLLEKADSFLDRTETVKVAISLGMPLNEIEAYLDWIDAVRSMGNGNAPAPPDPERPPESGGSPDQGTRDDSG